MFDFYFGHDNGLEIPKSGSTRPAPLSPPSAGDGAYAMALRAAFAELEQVYTLYTKFRADIEPLAISLYIIDGFDAFSAALALVQDVLSNDYSDNPALDEETRDFYRRTRKFKARLLSNVYCKYFGDTNDSQSTE